MNNFNLLRRCNYAASVAPLYSSMGRSKGSVPSNKSIINSSFQLLKYSLFHQSHSMMMNKVINNSNSTDDDIDKAKQNAVAKVDYDEYDDYAEPVTTGQKVSQHNFYSQLNKYFYIYKYIVLLMHYDCIND